jgi:3-deoxy-D-arabino-heptulosonate 7-phosphate (DAHP) synthase class II
MKAFRFYSLMVLAILMTAGLTACSSDDKEFMGNEPVASYKGDIVKGISVSLSDFESAGSETRTAYSSTDC